MTSFIYKLAINLFGLGIWVAQFFSTKAKRWRSDRKAFKVEELKKFKNSIWFHCSSLGELEQAFPLIKEFKQKGDSIVVSLFSHSGYDHISNYPEIDFAFLLPLDTKRNAKILLQHFDPALVIWNKNDLWFSMLSEIHRVKIPLIFNAFYLKKNHFLLNPIFSPLRRPLLKAKKIYCLEQKTFDILRNIGFKNITVAGDTRVTRTLNRKNNPQPNPALKLIGQNKKVILLASIYQSDISICQNFIRNNPQYFYFIIPHEVDKSNIQSITSSLNIPLIGLDDIIRNQTDKTNCLVDKIGVLFDLYQWADLVYIGGGFEKGIHNILEACVWGKTVLIGPKHENFWEAEHFIHNNWVHPIDSPETFEKQAKLLLKNEEMAKTVSKELNHFFENYPNPVKNIVEYCHSFLEPDA